MKVMKVILKRAIENLGGSGEIVSVKPGYARNYLLPQGLAYEASKGNLRRIDEEHRATEERGRRAFLEGRRRMSQLDGTTVVFRARASEDGRLFGSISPADIAARLTALATDFEVERRHVVLDEPLKELGSHRVTIALRKGIETEIHVQVEPEED